MTEPYTDAEHTANLDRWMNLTDQDRSNAFYALHSAVGALAQLGNDRLATDLRNLLNKTERYHHNRVNGKCSWCGDPMPVPERPQGGGRTKLYCSPAHKQAAHRAGDLLPKTASD
jgi:hypothetical protein